MTKKLLFMFDTDAMPSVFDTVVAYDGGADHVCGYDGVNTKNVGALVDGTIYTRGGKEKQSTAIFVGGGDMSAGEEVFEAVKKRFFSNFRVSCMLDSNGSNTTAAAGVALIAKEGSLKGKRAVVLAGTGPVGMRAAAMLAQEGAEVSITSRDLKRSEKAAEAIKKRFEVTVTAVAGADSAERTKAVKDANIVFSAGAIGLELLPEDAWKDNKSLEMLADCNAQPPMGIGGVEAMDKAKERHGKKVFGALGMGGLKLKLHRECISQMFESADKVFDAEEIFALAKKMA